MTYKTKAINTLSTAISSMAFAFPPPIFGKSFFLLMSLSAFDLSVLPFCFSVCLVCLFCRSRRLYFPLCYVCLRLFWCTTCCFFESVGFCWCVRPFCLSFYRFLCCLFVWVVYNAVFGCAYPYPFTTNSRFGILRCNQPSSQQPFIHARFPAGDPRLKYCLDKNQHSRRIGSFML